MHFPIYFVRSNLPLEMQANILKFARLRTNSMFYQFWKTKKPGSIYYLPGIIVLRISQ